MIEYHSTIGVHYHRSAVVPSSPLPILRRILSQGRPRLETNCWQGGVTLPIVLYFDLQGQSAPNQIKWSNFRCFALCFTEPLYTPYGLWEVTKSCVQKICEFLTGRYDSLSITFVSYTTNHVQWHVLAPSTKHLALGLLASLQDSCFLICTLLDLD